MTVSKLLLMLAAGTVAASAQSNRVVLCDQQASPKCLTWTVGASLPSNITITGPVLPLTGGTMTGAVRFSGGFGNGGVVSVGSNIEADTDPAYNQAPDNCTQPPVWSSGTTYALGRIASYAGTTYTSLAGGNSAHQPNTSPTWWTYGCIDDRSRIDWFGGEWDFVRIKGKGTNTTGDYFDWTRFGPTGVLPVHQINFVDSSFNTLIHIDESTGLSQTVYSFTGNIWASSTVQAPLYRINNGSDYFDILNTGLGTHALDLRDSGSNAILQYRNASGAWNTGTYTFNGNVAITGTCTGCGVSSITGTANQVNASASTGAVTLSLPQDIATGSIVRHLGLLLNQANDNSGYQLQSNGGIEMTAAGANVLSKGTGNNAVYANAGGMTSTTGYWVGGTQVINSSGVWVGGGTGGVTSLAGTANQVNVSASTGAVTLSLPQDIATASIVRHGGLLLGQANDASGYLLQSAGGIEQTSAAANILSKGTANNAIYANAGGVTSTTGYWIGATQMIDSSGGITVNGTARFLGSVNQTALGVARLDSGVQGGSPRMVFEQASGSGTPVWLIDNAATGFRWYIPNHLRMLLETLTGPAWGNTTISLFNSGDVVAVKLHTGGDSYFSGGNLLLGMSSGDGSGARLQVSGAINASGVIQSTATGTNVGLQVNSGTFQVLGNGLVGAANYNVGTAGTIQWGGQAALRYSGGHVQYSDNGTTWTSFSSIGGGAVSSVSGSGAGISVSPTTGAVVVTNTGVTSLAGTTNQITTSASSGAVTLSLPQDIATASIVRHGGLLIGQANDASGYLVQSAGGIEQTSSVANILSKGTAANAIYANAGGVAAINGFYVGANGATQVINSSGYYVGGQVNTAGIVSASTFWISGTYTGQTLTVTLPAGASQNHLYFRGGILVSFD